MVRTVKRHDGDTGSIWLIEEWNWRLVKDLYGSQIDDRQCL
jgi:hypothetical protein